MGKKCRQIIWLIKYAVVIQTIIIIIGFVLFIKLFVYSDWPSWMSFVVFCIMVLISYTPIILVQIKNQRIINNLLKECDPDPFIEAYTYISQRLAGKKGNNYYYILLSIGLVSSGRFDEALRMLEKCGSFVQNRAGRYQKALYHISLFDVYLGLENKDKAAYHHNICRERIPMLPSKKIRSALTLGCDRNVYEMRMAGGDFNGTEDVFLDALKNAKSNYERVSAQYTLGRIYAHAGQIDKARAAFAYAAENGNKLYVAAQAREKLAEMDA